MTAHFASKRVLVTGSCGTIGRELVRRLLEMEQGPAEISGIDNNESAIFMQRIEEGRDPRARFRLCDVRDAHALREAMTGIDIVLHAAALKHVTICEEAPTQAIATNLTGLQNVIDAAIESKVERVIATSSDKAVHPNSVMGLTKLLGERMISAANASRRGAGTILASTRFGNVVGSSGSVFQIFQNQIKQGKPITLTDMSMTRFVMSANEAAELVLDAAGMAQGGEVFVFRTMPMIRISDLAETMRRELAPRHGHNPMDVPIALIGAKTGEKNHEQLMSEDECSRAYAKGPFCVIPPLFLKDGLMPGSSEERPVALRSDAGPFLSPDEIAAKLVQWGLI